MLAVESEICFGGEPMIPSSLIPDLSTLRPDLSPEDNLLNARLLLRFLADNAQELQLNDGRFVGEIVEFQLVLRQIADAARITRSSIAPAPIVDCDEVEHAESENTCEASMK
jgi:hypothetical protein